MPDKCCVPGCRSNYIGEDGYISVFTFPSLKKRAEIREKWIKSIPRKDFLPTRRSVVCIKHFRREDIIIGDKFVDSKGLEQTVYRTKLKLRPDACPTIFPLLPWYYKENLNGPKKIFFKKSSVPEEMADKYMIIGEKDTELVTMANTSNQKDKLNCARSSAYVCLNNAEPNSDKISCGEVNQYSQMPKRVMRMVPKIRQELPKSDQELKQEFEEFETEIKQEPDEYDTEITQEYDESGVYDQCSPEITQECCEYSPDKNHKMEICSCTDCSLPVNTLDHTPLRKEPLHNGQFNHLYENGEPENMSLDAVINQAGSSCSKELIQVTEPEMAEKPQYQNPSVSHKKMAQVSSTCESSSSKIKQIGSSRGKSKKMFSDEVLNSQLNKSDKGHGSSTSFLNVQHKTSDKGHGSPTSFLNDEYNTSDKGQMSETSFLNDEYSTSDKGEDSLTSFLNDEHKTGDKGQGSPTSFLNDKHKKSDTTYLCDVCGLSFACNDMSAHKKTHEGEKPYKCDVCNKGFNHLRYVRSHKRVHTGKRPYVCDICGVGFTWSSNLLEHKRIHTGEKPFACNICDFRFSSASYLRVHMRRHTGEKPYKCNICGVVFSQSNHLSNHKKKHTREKSSQECLLHLEKTTY